MSEHEMVRKRPTHNLFSDTSMRSRYFDGKFVSVGDSSKVQWVVLMMARGKV